MALKSILYLLLLEIEGDRQMMEDLYEQGKSLSSPEMIQAAKLVGLHSARFMRLEEQYLSLTKEMRAAGGEKN